MQGGALVRSVTLRMGLASDPTPEAQMPHLYFHLMRDDEQFSDTIGREISDLKTAHSQAILLASDAMAFCELEEGQHRPSRLVVTIADSTGNVLLSVVIRCESAPCDIRRVTVRHKFSSAG